MLLPVEFNAPNLMLTVSVLLSILFFIYGFNTLHLTLRARRYKNSFAEPVAIKPKVAIHLPIYNEFYVVGRLLDACVRLAESYGKGLVGIYVIDDSNDETSRELDGLAAEYKNRGYQLKLIRRGNREGFKAGALQCALGQTTEKYVAVLDADFVPPPDFLDRTVPYLELDPHVGFVQSKWSHLDRGFNSVTQSVAIGIDAHFLLEQQGRNGSGYLMNFNGSAGVIRVDAIREAGGWASDTLAEDLDLSYRMQLCGYKGHYLNDLEVPAELPPTISSLKRQQGRWARGSLQAARKLLRRIAGSKHLTLGQKLEAWVHLTYYLVHPLMVASFLLAIVAVFLQVNVIKYGVNITLPIMPVGGTAAGTTAFSFIIVPWIVFSFLIAMSTFAVLLYCIQAVRLQKLGLFENVKEIIILVILGYGISISNSVHALTGIFSREAGTFSRTPKYAIERSGQSWRGKKYQMPFNKTSLLEAGAVGLAVFASVFAYQTGNLGILPILLVYLTGYAFVLYLTIRQTMGSAGLRDS